MKHINLKRSVGAILVILLFPLYAFSGGAECYPCGENNPGVVCPSAPGGTSCGIEFTADGWIVTCDPGGQTVTGTCQGGNT